MLRCPRAARCGLRNKGRRGLLRLRPCWGGRGRSGFGRASLRSLAYMGRVRRTASPALRAYMPRAHINAPPLLRKTCTRASRIAVFRPDFDARVHVLGEALCGFESLARCRKKPGLGDWHRLRASMAERGTRGAASRRRPLRPLARPCVLRWKTLRVSSAPHLHRVRIPHPLQKKARIPKERRLGIHYGGERGIRTLETLTRPTVFKTAAFNRSAISPW